MRPKDANILHRTLGAHRTAFLYSGAFHDDHTSRLIALGEAQLEELAGRAGARGRLAFIMVEAYQNILRHRAPLPTAIERGQGRSLFILTCDAEGQRVMACNPVAREQVPGLRALLGALHGLDAEALKQRYLTALQHEHDHTRRGAGLGLIEMARRSGCELAYDLRGLGEGHEQFILAVSLGAAAPQQAFLPEVAALHGTVVQQDILLLHTGERPPGVQEALLRMVEEDLDEHREAGAARGRAYLAACAALDHHAPPGTPRFMALVREGAHFGLTAGCTMPAQQAQAFADRIARLRDLDRSELDRRYRQAVLRRTDDAEADLLDLARVSLEPLEFGAFAEERGPEVFAAVRVVI